MSSDPFLTLDQVAEELNTSKSQATALVRRKELRSIKMGGRGQWRVRRSDLEAYIEQAYRDTDEWIDGHPYAGGDDDEDGA